MYLTDAFVTSVSFVQESKEAVLASDIVCVLVVTSSIVRECRQQLRRERATLKMNEHDAIALLAIDSDEPELGIAFSPSRADVILLSPVKTATEP
jgi:hypothetical protein